MKPARAIGFIIFSISLTLVACGRGATASPVPPAITPIITAAGSPSPRSTTGSFLQDTPRPPTSTPLNPCDLAIVDFCVGEAFFFFQAPILPPGIDSITRGYPYGSTEGGTRVPHHGVEFYNASGTPVLAAADGRVYFAGDDATRMFSPWSGFYGNLVVLEHTLAGGPFIRLFTLYAHLSKLEVSSGQVVTSGEKLGEVGLTGTASGSHLHFEVRVDPEDYGSTLNPELWLVPHPGNGTLALLAEDNLGEKIFPTFNVQYYPLRDKPATAATQVDGYAPDMFNPRDPWNEIAALGDQPSGWYRVTFLWAGVLYERWVEILPGKLTRILMMVK
jgi:murein DD-endopeptidase MepM/ murein hydrolase activator NlpD